MSCRNHLVNFLFGCPILIFYLDVKMNIIYLQILNNTLQGEILLDLADSCFLHYHGPYIFQCHLDQHCILTKISLLQPTTMEN